MEELLKNTTERALNYLNSIENRSVAPNPAAVAELDEFDRPFPEQPVSPQEVIRVMDEIGSPATVATAGGRYFGFVIGGTLPAALAANWLASAWDQNAFDYILSPSAMRMEHVASKWLLDALHLPTECGVSFVTGATMANFTALTAARGAVLAGAGWDLDENGLFEAPQVQVVLGEEAHPTIRKSLGLLGLGRNRVTTVPTDSQGRMRPGKLPAISGPAIVILQAGNVNTGAFDPVGEICDIAHDAGAWVHVDGAFGLWALASSNLEHLTHGLSKADSWATDGHKWLNVPYDSGISIIRNPEHLRRATSLSAAYLPEIETYTPESSRRARGVEVWAALMSLGRSGLDDLISRTCAYARRFAEGFRDAGFEILNDVVLNQVLVKFGNQDTTSKIISAIQEDGVCWCGGTVWHNQPAMRISVSSWATTEKDVEVSLDSMLRIASTYS